MVHNEKSPLAAGFGRKNKPGGLSFLVFINLVQAGDYMAKYSKLRAQKQRVLHD